MTDKTYPEALRPDAMLIRLLPPVKPQPGRVYVPSRFVLSFEHRGERFMYNTLTGQCLKGDLPASAVAGEGDDALIGCRFLVPENTDETASYNGVSALMRAFTRKKGIRGYTIMPTLNCNARCVYCYQDGMAQTSMTKDTVAEVIRFIRQTHGENRVDLDWFGGEPLLRPDVIDRVCAAVREDGCEYVSSMTSNGSLITPQTVEKMTEAWHLETVQISMDGARDDYYARKRYVGGQDQYRRVMEAVSLLSAAGVRVAVRCNVDGQNWDGVPRFLDDLRAGVASKENVSVYLSPLNGVRTGDADIAMWRKVRDARPLIEAAGFRPAPFMEPEPRFRVTHCMADSGAVVIAPDGALYACEHCLPESRLGDIRKGLTAGAAACAFCRTDRTRDKCARCPFLPHCTSFAHCPVEDTHCREVRELLTLDYLRRLLDGKAAPEDTGNVLSNC